MTITQNNGAIFTTTEIIALLMDGKISKDEATKLLDAAKAKGNGQSHQIKVGAKGGVCMRSIPGASVQYGLTLYPKTLQWLFEHKEELEKFMEANKASLSWGKPEKDAK